MFISQNNCTNKIQAMKHIVRSVKYFFYFSILFCLIIAALVLIGAVEGNIDEILEGGYDSLWKIAIFFAVVAAIYPKFGFVRRKLDTSAEWESVKEEAVSYFEGKNFKTESETPDTVSFRRRNVMERMTKMGEDRITIRKTEDGAEMEGLRKDVTLYATGLEYRLPPHNEKQENI